MATQREAEQPSSGIYYGWCIVIAAFFAFEVVYRDVIYSFTVFVKSIAKTFGVTPTKVMAGFTLTDILNNARDG